MQATLWAFLVLLTMNEKPRKTSDAYYYALALRIAADFGVTMAVPAVSAAFVGQWLDERWGTKPYVFVFLLIVAFFLTAILIYRKAKKYAKLYNRDNP